MLGISYADWDASILPGLGGSLASLRFRGRDILRPAGPYPRDPLQTACFPLVPYCNRIAQGRFAWAGETIVLPRNFGEHPHSLHGTGWQSEWDVETAEADRTVLALDHAADEAWPWDFSARQTFALSESGASITLELINRSQVSMPAGLGLHPYFPVTSQTRVSMVLGRPWHADKDCLPTVLGEVGDLGDWSTAAVPQSDTLIDHCFEARDQHFAIVEPGIGTITVSFSDALSWLHVLMVPGADFVCIEPVSHFPDALNRSDRPTGMRSLNAGERMSVSTHFAVVPD